MNESEFDKKWNSRYMEHLNSHSEPYPETRERLATLEANHESVMQKIEEILGRFDKFEAKLDCALAKKADKETQWAEKVLIWVGSIIGLGLLGLTGGLIVKAIIHFN